MILEHMKTLEKLLLVDELIIHFFLLNYHYFKENYKLIAIDWNKQQSVDADPGATD